MRNRYGHEPVNSLLLASLRLIHLSYGGIYLNFHLTQIALIVLGALLLWVQRNWLERKKFICLWVESQAAKVNRRFLLASTVLVLACFARGGSIFPRKNKQFSLAWKPIS